jgi:hypothetical protein
MSERSSNISARRIENCATLFSWLARLQAGEVRTSGGTPFVKSESGTLSPRQMIAEQAKRRKYGAIWPIFAE